MEKPESRTDRLGDAVKQVAADANEVLWHVHCLTASLRDLRIRLEAFQSYLRAKELDDERARERDRRHHSLPNATRADDEGQIMGSERPLS